MREYALLAICKKWRNYTDALISLNPGGAVSAQRGSIWGPLVRILGGVGALIAALWGVYTLRQANLQRWQDMERSHVYMIEEKIYDFEASHPEVICLYAEYPDHVLECSNEHKKLTRANVAYVQMVNDFLENSKRYDERWCKSDPIFGDALWDCTAGPFIDEIEADPYGVFKQVRESDVGEAIESASSTGRSEGSDKL